jgi:hypothetical protein
MISSLHRCWMAVLRSVRLRPPVGHMQMLRDVIDRREDDRVAREAAVGKVQANGGAEASDGGE